MANTIAALLHGRDNNFNLIRFLAASAVIVDHSFALVAHDQTADALIDVERLEIGRLAVDSDHAGMAVREQLPRRARFRDPVVAFVEHPTLKRKAWAGDCVGSLMRGAQQRLTTFLGLGAAPKPQASASER